MPVSKGQRGVREEMHKFKHGQLHSGSRTGPIVRSRKQAIAIALSEAGMSKMMKKSTKGSPSMKEHELACGYRKLSGK